MFKVNNKTPERRHWRHSFAYIVRRSSVSIVKFEHVNAGWVPKHYCSKSTMETQKSVKSVKSKQQRRQSDIK